MILVLWVLDSGSYDVGQNRTRVRRYIYVESFVSGVLSGILGPICGDLCTRDVLGTNVYKGGDGLGISLNLGILARKTLVVVQTLGEFITPRRACSKLRSVILARQTDVFSALIWLATCSPQ